MSPCVTDTWYPNSLPQFFSGLLTLSVYSLLNGAAGAPEEVFYGLGYRWEEIEIISAHKDQILFPFLYFGLVGPWVLCRLHLARVSNPDLVFTFSIFSYLILIQRKIVLSAACPRNWFCFILFPCRKLCLEPSSEITKPVFSSNMTNRVWKWLPTPDSGTLWFEV